MNCEGQIYMADVTGKYTAKSDTEACGKARICFWALKLTNEGHIARK
jgi:hypothetical protein